MLKNIIGIEESDIILMGRSMGSGPAIHLAGMYKPFGLILISPYKSIKSVLYNKINFLSSLFEEQFNNIHEITKISKETNILFIHGK